MPDSFPGLRLKNPSLLRGLYLFYLAKTHKILFFSFCDLTWLATYVTEGEDVNAFVILWEIVSE